MTRQLVVERDMDFTSISRQNNINAIRYYLAICILMGHYCVLTGTSVVQLPRIFGGAGSFFAISGFLMFPSFAKNSDVKRYLRRRANRIFPPYFLIVIAAALLGVFVSSLSPSGYFSSAGFWKYLGANLSFMNFLCPDLPGVFDGGANRMPSVNGSLWTMKGEVACYLTIPVVFWMVRKKLVGMNRLLCVLMAFFGLMYALFRGMEINVDKSYNIAARQCMVMFLFYMGGFLNLHLDYVRRHWRPVMTVCAVLLLFDYVNKYWEVIDLPVYLYFIYDLVFIPIASGLMVIVCSVIGKWGSFLSRHNALTYEIYLFHYPVIQVLIYFGCVREFGFYPTLLLAIAVTSVLAFLAWKFIGSRFHAQ